MTYIPDKASTAVYCLYPCLDQMAYLYEEFCDSSNPYTCPTTPRGLLLEVELHPDHRQE